MLLFWSEGLVDQLEMSKLWSLVYRVLQSVDGTVPLPLQGLLVTVPRPHEYGQKRDPNETNVLSY